MRKKRSENGVHLTPTCVLVLGFVYLPIGPLTDNTNDVKFVHTTLSPVAFCLSPLTETRTTDSGRDGGERREMEVEEEQTENSKNSKC